MRYGLGFMLGGRRFSPFGPDTPEAFGHLGLSNVFSWADPERELVVGRLSAFFSASIPPTARFSRQSRSRLGRVSPC